MCRTPTALGTHGVCARLLRVQQRVGDSDVSMTMVNGPEGGPGPGNLSGSEI